MVSVVYITHYANLLLDLLIAYWLVKWFGSDSGFMIGRQFQFRNATVDLLFGEISQIGKKMLPRVEFFPGVFGICKRPRKWPGRRPKKFGGSCFKLDRESVLSGLQSLVLLDIAFSSAKIPEFFGLGAYFLGLRSTPKLVCWSRSDWEEFEART